MYAVYDVKNYYDETKELKDLDMVYKGYYYLINGNPAVAKRSVTVRAIKLQNGIYSVRKCNVKERGLAKKVIGEQI